MQTTAADIRAGWRSFRAWERRFRNSTFVVSFRPQDKIYLASWEEVQQNDFMDEIAGDVLEQKIAFMKAYFATMALESKSFNDDLRLLLRFQSRLNAPRLLGFWFSQSNPGKFGAGASTLFQGERVNFFCENMRQIDFSDVSAILPYDQIMTRCPGDSWTSRKLQRLVDHIKWDLAFDGTETDIAADFAGEFAYLTLASPDYGLAR